MSTLWDYRDSAWADGFDLAGLRRPSDRRFDRQRRRGDERGVDAYLVVDTGTWIVSRKRVIPAGVVSAVEHVSTTILVTLTKDQVKAAPDYDAAAWTDESRDRQGDYYRAYQQY